MFVLIMVTLCPIAYGDQLCANPKYPNLYNSLCYESACSLPYFKCGSDPTLCVELSAFCVLRLCGGTKTETDCTTCSRQATSSAPFYCSGLSDEVKCGACEKRTIVDAYRCTCERSAESFQLSNYTSAQVALMRIARLVLLDRTVPPEEAVLFVKPELTCQ